MLLEQLNKILEAYGFTGVRNMSELKKEVDALFSFKEPIFVEDFVEEMLSYLTKVPYKSFSRLADVERFIGRINNSETDLKQKKWWLEKMSLRYSIFYKEYNLLIDKEVFGMMKADFFKPEMEVTYKKEIGEEVYDTIRLKKIFAPDQVEAEVLEAINDKMLQTTEDQDVSIVLEQMEEELSQVLKRIYPLELEKHTKHQRAL